MRTDALRSVTTSRPDVAHGLAGVTSNIPHAFTRHPPEFTDALTDTLADTFTGAAC